MNAAGFRRAIKASIAHVAEFDPAPADGYRRARSFVAYLSGAIGDEPDLSAAVWELLGNQPRKEIALPSTSVEF
jgi:hypothetical protein